MNTIAFPSQQILIPPLKFPAWVRKVGDPLRMFRGAMGDGIFAQAMGGAGVVSVTPWYLAGGITAAQCMAAYQPKGAASLAASYTNLANVGTYTAAPGTAPAFATATGWTFNGATNNRYLETGIPSNQSPVSCIVRLTPTSFAAYRSMLGNSSSTPGAFEFDLEITTGKLLLVRSNVAILATSSIALSLSVDAVCGISYNGVTGAYKFYINGIAAGNGTSASALTAGITQRIGATTVASAVAQPLVGDMAALAKYNIALSDAQHLAVATALLAI